MAPMSRLRLALAILAALGLGLLLSVRPAARALGRGLVRDDRPVSADVIVVLGGDVRRRAPHAAALWKEGLAPRVLAVGGTVEQGRLSEARKTARVLAEAGVPAEVVTVLGQDEPSTQAEAAAIAIACAEQGWIEVAVVTSPYHTWRAGQILEHSLPEGTRLSMVPSPLDPFNAEGWWQDPMQRRRVRNEVGKYLLWRLLARADAEEQASR